MSAPTDHSPSPYGISVWTVYENPSDYPGRFIARRHWVGRWHVTPTGEMLNEGSLEAIREHLQRRGLWRVDRSPEDDPVIVETWV